MWSWLPEIKAQFRVSLTCPQKLGFILPWGCQSSRQTPVWNSFWTVPCSCQVLHKRGRADPHKCWCVGVTEARVRGSVSACGHAHRSLGVVEILFQKWRIFQRSTRTRDQEGSEIQQLWKITMSSPFRILLVWGLLYHKGVIISQACGKGTSGVHETFKGEGADGRKPGEYRDSWSGR